MLVCVPLALRLLGVRDWRCYGLALLTAPVLDTVSLGALSSAMLLGVAAAWRYRDRPYVAAPITALTAVAKLFRWPLFVWLLATRRIRGLRCRRRFVLSSCSSAAGRRSASPAARLPTPAARSLAGGGDSELLLVGLVRLDGGAATALTVLLAVAVRSAVVLAARGPTGTVARSRSPIAGALVATPVLWLHYLVLLFVPIALARPRLSALWFVPLAFWVSPIAHSNGSVWRTCFVLAVAALIVLRSLAPRG